ncbi:hypothetical protein GUITHDRAFT_154483 [Guillardia theta CCMP2712]|uniref:Uncharacterized protein n=3 Tax=Guillardia theta TaxID=55529 RepID=L1ISK4_GUITC|nr:hypothetical protein GUITHDRAFT_154483 [Guillardia theta CCMP2712]EKX39218.1 hypothetical protein GUITHDRAFT_154483 [Guillardia theta CCMP2712]|eukprot:XP_005826198.1 hypothetical protein GUITHDRAFT_154483 [Guillardia theta CCMP2712]
MAQVAISPEKSVVVKDCGCSLYQFRYTNFQLKTQNFSLAFYLIDGNATRETISLFVQVLFCQDVLLPGQNVIDLAQRHHLDWQALLTLNSEILNPKEIYLQPPRRLWTCSETLQDWGHCKLEGLTGFAILRIGKIHRIHAERLLGVIHSYRASFTQIVKNNVGRLGISKNITDFSSYESMVLNSTIANNIAPEGEEVCIVSDLSDVCYV